MPLGSSYKSQHCKRFSQRENFEFRGTMSIKLYHSGLSTCSKQVRHCLREKKIDYESCYVELWRYENLSAPYLAINPNGVVPTLVHNGTPIINAFCIMEYIDDVFPETPLRPTDAFERARSRYWSWTADDIHAVLARITFVKFLKSKVDELSSDDQALMLKHTPTPERRARWQQLVDGGYTELQSRADRESVVFLLTRMEKELNDRGPWLVGSDFSLGDVSMLAMYHRISEVLPAILDDQKIPELKAWWERAMQRPATRAVYCEGPETPARPQRKSVAGIFDYRTKST